MLIGIVGKPSAGKSTFLNAACLTEAKTASYPFTTIDPNLGTSFVRKKCVCSELKVEDSPKNSICKNGIRFIPVKLLDVAGLVPDAHLGKGMGNQFLSDLSRADVLIHVIDISGSLDAEGNDIKEGTRDPYDDIRFLEKEINYWFRDILTRKDWNKFIRKIKQEKLNFADMLFERLNGLIKKEHILKAINATKLDLEHIDQWSDEKMLDFATTLRCYSKPIIIAANKIDKPVSVEIYNKLKKKIQTEIIPCSALAEYWLRKFEEEGSIKYLPGDSSFKIIENSNLTSKQTTILKNIQKEILDVYGDTGIQKLLNTAIFNKLEQIVVYPVYDLSNYSDKDSNVLPDAHLTKQGTKLRDFVRDKIHTELAENFIYGMDGRTKMRLSENYELKDNDIVKIVSAAR